MSTPAWKTSYPNQERSRWSRSEPVLLDRAEAMEAGRAVVVDPAAKAATVSGAAPAKYLQRMAVKAGDKIVLVWMSDVLWIQSYGNLVRLHLENASYEHRSTIKNTYSHLDPERFVRVHRNAIVNLDHVTEFDLPRCGNAFVHLRNGKALPISKAVRRILRRGLLSQSYASTSAADLE